MNAPIREILNNLKKNCNKHANGTCFTLACLQSGGYVSGPVDYTVATCATDQQIKALENLIQIAEKTK